MLLNKYFLPNISCLFFLLSLFLLSQIEVGGQSINSNSNPALKIDNAVDAPIDLNPFLQVTEKEEDLYYVHSWEDLSKIRNWQNWDTIVGEENKAGILVKIQIDRDSARRDTLKKILYLDDLQYVTVFVNGKQIQKAGILLEPHKRQIRRGLILPLIGYSSQVEIDLLPGINEIFLEIGFLVQEPFRPEIKLYDPENWRDVVFEDRSEKLVVQGLVLGALWMMALYHLLIFLQRRDTSFLWYSIYTSAVSLVLMIESGLFQAFLFPEYPVFCRLLPILQFHSSISYVIYWLFLRNFVNLKKLLPFWDKFLKWFLVIFYFIGLFTGLYYLYRLEGEYLDMTLISYAIPLFGLGAGVCAFFRIVRVNNKLANLFLIGSFILLLGVLVNSIISGLIYFGWIEEIFFPHFIIMEVAVILEILVFALALGYRLRVKDKEQQRIKELDQLKSKFFANISHEFRTPLTVISGLTDQISGFENERKLIKRNSNNLLHLVNQLLDLSKLDSNAVKSNLITSDIVYFLNYITESFYSPSKEKEIRLNFYSEESSLMMDYDEMKIQQILNNLLSNAIKFTPEKGKVIVHVKKLDLKGESFLQIKVKDSGIGVSKIDQSRIFDRFYQSDTKVNRPGEGTGIGLALTKELVELAGGSIAVDSEIGEWTEFTVLLPIRMSDLGTSQYEGSKQKVPAEITVSPFALKSQAQSNIPSPKRAGDSELDRLLIIEDNPDIVTYLTELLKNQFEISVAINGKLGIEKALEAIPDIILSDVMMPEKNGYEVCQFLKNDERTSHIPIVLLTARASADDKVAGLLGGADAYLTKPFNKEELFVRLEKLIELRKTLQKRYSSVKQIAELTKKQPLETNKKKENTPAANDIPELNLEDAFLKKIMTVIEKRIEDPKLGINDLCKEAGLGSMQMNRKLKALTGKTGNVLIRSIRLQKAKELLRTTDHNISEVAYRVGFNDPNYFSRTFSEEFGKPPTDFRK